MKKIKKNPINSSSIVGSERNPDGTFREGHIKVGGKELGTRDFATDFDEAVPTPVALTAVLLPVAVPVMTEAFSLLT